MAVNRKDITDKMQQLQTALTNGDAEYIDMLDEYGRLLLKLYSTIK